MSDHTQSEEAFGTFRQEESGQYSPDPACVEKAMSSPDSAIRAFCSACGRYFELTLEGAQEVAQREQLELSEDLSRSLLVFPTCTSCKTQQEGEVKLLTY